MIVKQRENREQVEIFSIEEFVPADHLLRKIDSAIDFTYIYEIVEDLYCADNGRPSIDPVVIFKMVLIQHLYGLPSLRRTVDGRNQRGQSRPRQKAVWRNKSNGRKSNKWINNRPGKRSVSQRRTQEMLCIYSTDRLWQKRLCNGCNGQFGQCSWQCGIWRIIRKTHRKESWNRSSSNGCRIQDAVDKQESIGWQENTCTAV